MKEEEIVEWAAKNDSNLVRGFAWRLLARKQYRKGNWIQAAKIAQKALAEYPPNTALYRNAERDYIKYQFTTILADELVLFSDHTAHQNDAELLLEISE